MATPTKKFGTRPSKRKIGDSNGEKRADVTRPSPRRKNQPESNSKKRQRVAQSPKPLGESGDALEDIPTKTKRVRVSAPKIRGDRLKLLAEGAQLTEQAQWLWTAFLAQAGAKISPLEQIPFSESDLLALPRPDVSSDVSKADPMSHLAAHIKREHTAAPTTGVLRAAGPGVRTAKLFAKHMKVGEQVEVLRNPVNVAVGTPSRMNQLARVGALGMGNLRLIALDMQKSAKGLTLFDIPELRVDFWDFFRAHVYDPVVNKQAKIGLI